MTEVSDTITEDGTVIGKVMRYDWEFWKYGGYQAIQLIITDPYGLEYSFWLNDSNTGFLEFDLPEAVNGEYTYRVVTGSHDPVTGSFTIEGVTPMTFESTEAADKLMESGNGN